MNGREREGYRKVRRRGREARERDRQERERRSKQDRINREVVDDRQLVSNTSNWCEAKETGDDIFVSEQCERLVGSKIQFSPWSPLVIP